MWPSGAFSLSSSALKILKCSSDLSSTLTHCEKVKNVVEIVSKKIQRLDPMAQEVLKIGACLGNQFDIDVVQRVVHFANFKAATTMQNQPNHNCRLRRVHLQVRRQQTGF